jgi:transposase-like protein
VYEHGLRAVLSRVYNVIVPCVKVVTTDFERAEIEALERLFPHAKWFGCLFHLLQAWHRKFSATMIFSSSLFSVYCAIIHI